MARSSRSFLLALQFLTRLPVPGDPYSPEALAASPRWYPAVGALIGAILAVALAAMSLAFPPLLVAALTIAVGLILTGALHEDGFADLCDGLGGGRERERALEIMRDSQIGSYGALGLCFSVGLRVIALSTLAALGSGLAAAALIAGHTASRAAMVWVIHGGAYVRDDGAGRGIAGGTLGRGLALAAGTALVAMVPLALLAGLPAVLGAAILLVLSVLALRRLFERRLGGYTGDCLGAVQQVGEIAVYLGLLAWL